ncbi:poly(ethylene terephthalate) hydrolase family protein [Amycolatopsis sp. NPDC004368]
MKRRFTLPALVALVFTSLVSPATAAPAAVPDPLAPGPHRVEEAGYTLGDQAFQPTGFPGKVELTAEAYYPADTGNGPYPLVVLLHGRHPTCFPEDPDQETGDWPCPSGMKPIPSYLGYGALGTSLASHGYAVISISANGINSVDNQDTSFGMPARGELVLKHLSLLRDWQASGTGRLPAAAVRSFDLGRIGLMGHSRGGEGMVNAIEQNAQLASPFAIRALFTLAPTDKERRVPEGLPVGTLVGDCDQDVSSLEGVHYYDDGRYRLPDDRFPRELAVVGGADHNFFNTVWSPGADGGFDDWFGASDSPCAPASPTRLTASQQVDVGTAYMSSFFRYHLGGEQAFAPLWKGAAGAPASLGATKVDVSYHAPSATGQREDVFRFATTAHTVANDLGGAVTLVGGLNARPCGGASTDASASCLQSAQTVVRREPHRGWGLLGVSSEELSWTTPGASLVNAIPTQHQDVRQFGAVRLRAGVDFTSGANPTGAAQDLDVVLTDASGHSSAARVSRFSDVLDYPKKSSDPNETDPHLLLNQIRIPLSAFIGVDLAAVRSVSLVFGATSHGAIVVADLALTD